MRAIFSVTESSGSAEDMLRPLLTADAWQAGLADRFFDGYAAQAEALGVDLEPQKVELTETARMTEKEYISYLFTVEVRMTNRETGGAETAVMSGAIAVEKADGQWKVSALPQQQPLPGYQEYLARIKETAAAQ